jgi:hypothetical protein
MSVLTIHRGIASGLKSGDSISGGANRQREQGIPPLDGALPDVPEVVVALGT